MWWGDRTLGRPYSCSRVHRRFRLRDSAAFERVRRHGTEYRNRWLVLLAAPNEEDRTRFGFIVGRRRGNAVVRNTVKRRLREVVRLRLADDQVHAGFDVVLIARAAAIDADYHTLDAAIDDLLQQAGLVKEE